jgi:predicted transcriptional regulator
MYELYVNKKVDQGKAAAGEGKVVSHEEARKKVAKR